MSGSRYNLVLPREVSWNVGSEWHYHSFHLVSSPAFPDSDQSTSYNSTHNRSEVKGHCNLYIIMEYAPIHQESNKLSKYPSFKLFTLLKGLLLHCSKSRNISKCFNIFPNFLFGLWKLKYVNPYLGPCMFAKLRCKTSLWILYFSLLKFKHLNEKLFL